MAKVKTQCYAVVRRKRLVTDRETLLKIRETSDKQCNSNRYATLLLEFLNFNAQGN